MSEGWIDRAKLRVAEAQFDRLVTSSETALRPGLSAGTAIAVGLSLAILAVAPLIAILGIWLMLWSGFAVIATAIALVLLVMAWGMLPPVNRLAAPSLGRSEVPALFGLVDALAETLGAPRVDGLHIDPGYNAFMGHFGLRRRRVLGIGLALWQVLDREERIALLAHELAHEVNGDPARSRVIAAARHALITWVEMLVPDDRFFDIAQYNYGGDLPLARQVMRLVAWLLTIVGRGHWLLYMRLSQQAEYYADLLAARAAGTAASRRLLEKSVLLPYVRSLLVRRPGRPDGAGHALLSGLGAAVRAISADRRARLFARMEEEQVSVDASHPPTVYRLRFLERRDEWRGTFDAEKVRWDEIASELETYLEPYGQALLDDPGLL